MISIDTGARIKSTTSAGEVSHMVRLAERSLIEAAASAAKRGRAPASREWTWLAERILGAAKSVDYFASLAAHLAPCSCDACRQGGAA